MNTAIQYIGVDDHSLDLFEGQYALKQGITYNSYLILDEKIAIMDTVDQRAIVPWVSQLQAHLQGREPDYLVISHMESDHSAGIKAICSLYPHITLVGNVKTFQMVKQLFSFEKEPNMLVVEENTKLNLGQHCLKFILAPFVHWPEVMMFYEQTEKVLFSADAFGTFGNQLTDWEDEARRYYINIVGKYGKQVQQVLKKVSALDIARICPLHGPILKENLLFYFRLYDVWSQYQPEKEGVLIACASIHGHTMEACEKLKDMLERLGDTAIIVDLCRADLSQAVALAFCYDRLVLAASSYDGSVFTPMEDFLHRLRNKNFQNREVAFVENGAWAPMAIKAMKDILNKQKNLCFIDPTITIRGSLKEEQIPQLQALAQALMDCGCDGEDCF